MSKLTQSKNHGPTPRKKVNFLGFRGVGKDPITGKRRQWLAGPMIFEQPVKLLSALEYQLTKKVFSIRQKNRLGTAPQPILQAWVMAKLVAVGASRSR
jgi:hydroxyacyl-ACP dehydratase HTD2-like protein with hotdog domain